MSDEQQANDIQSLTDQRVVITLGGQTYSARRATLYDIGLINKFRKEQEDTGNTVNLELDAELFILCELLKPDHVFTPEQLAKSLPVAGVLEVAKALEQLGFTLPQTPATPSSGANSMP